MRDRLPWYLVAGLIVALFLLRGGHDEAEAVTRDNQALLRLGKRFWAQQDSLYRLQQTYSHQAFQFRALQIRNLAESRAVSARLDSSRTAADSLLAFPVLVTRLTAAGLACDSAFHVDSLALQTCGEENALLRIRMDTLEHALGRQIQVSQCRVLFLKCPTRQQAFAGGLLLGGGLVWFLGK